MKNFQKKLNVIFLNKRTSGIALVIVMILLIQVFMPIMKVHASNFIDDGIRTVTFDKQGGTNGTSTIVIDDGAAMPTINIPLKSGYEFMGYYRKPNGAGGQVWDNNGKPTYSTNIGVLDFIVYAYWKEVITITLNKNGGSGGTTTFYKSNIKADYYSDVTLNTKLSKITVPTKSNNVFSGYYYNDNLYIDKDGNFTDSFKESSITNLTAKWIAVDNNKYLITAQPGNGIAELCLSKVANAASGLVSSPAYFESGGKVYVFVKLKDGYTEGNSWYKTSNGWWRVDSYPSGFGESLNSNHDFGTINATANTYTITLNKQNGSNGTNSVTATYNSSMPNATMPTREGYAFAGYYDATKGGTKYYNADGSSAKVWDKTSNTTLYAHWVSKEYTITLDSGEGSGGTELISVSVDFEMPLIVLPSRTGYTFTGYYDATDGGTKYYNADGSSAKTWDKTSDTTLYAHWNIKTSSITFNKQGGTDGTNSVNATYGESMPNATMPTRSGGYIFLGYFSEINGEGTKYYNADGSSAHNWDLEDSNKTLYAYWIQSEEVINAINKINNIENPVVLTEACLEHITEARSAYDNLSSEYKEVIPNYSTLTSAEARYAELLQAKGDAEDVDTLINQIGVVSYPDSKSAITTAREAYDGSSDDIKSFVKDLETLTTAESEYESLRLEAINNVKSLIDSIETESYQIIETTISVAKSAYNALAEEDKAAVSNYEKLENAESLYGKIKNVDDKIKAIGTVEYTTGSKAKIDAAREAYNELNDNEKNMLGNEVKNVLENAELVYANLKADHDAAELVEAKIDEIGTVEYTDESKTKIDEARNAYENLTDEQKVLVRNLADLSVAETTYAGLKSDAEAIELVKEKIDAIGDVKFDDASKAKIDDARAAYDSLEGRLQDRVDNLNLLTSAEAKYEKLKTDNEAADAAEEKINAIGDVKNTEESKAKIDEARSAFDSLTDDQKALVDDEIKSILEDAEETYEKANNADDKIDLIGDVEYTEECKAKIDDARATYDSLTDKQKVAVLNLETLIKAENDYKKLKANHEAAELVEEKINAIGELKLSAETRIAIINARAAYEGLTEKQKELVNRDILEKLEKAETDYEKLKENNKLKIISISAEKMTTDKIEDLVIITNGELKQLIKVLLDGNKLDSENYTLVSGSTIFTLKDEYISTLSTGKHTVTFNYDDGRSVEAEFSIEEPTPETKKYENPITGDNIALWIGLALISMIGVVIVMKVLNKKRKVCKH